MTEEERRAHLEIIDKRKAERAAERAIEEDGRPSKRKAQGEEVKRH